jgi:phosphoglucosamine mutase
MLQSAFSAGVAAWGVDVVDLSVIPTPGVAAVSESRRLPAAMISASHNPFQDNGIKLFAPGGRKLSDELEARVEEELEDALKGSGSAHAVPTGSAIGRITRDAESLRWYKERLLSSIEARSLEAIRVVLDCANGSAAVTAPAVFEEAGAKIVALLGVEPDGQNINDGCGSTHPAPLQDVVTAAGADVGLAFDGDADRVIAVTETGAIVDGDQVLGLCALDLRGRGRLAGDTVVVTVMTNLGFHLAMREHGVVVHETDVGDRYVLEALERGGWALGGEQSGHVVFSDLATTGDGVLTGLQLLDLTVRSGRRLSDLAAEVMTRLPQVLRNVRVGDRDLLADASDVWSEVARIEDELGGRGRVLLRPSGTEPVVRVMVEAPTEAEASSAADRLCEVVARSLG